MKEVHGVTWINFLNVVGNQDGLVHSKLDELFIYYFQLFRFHILSCRHLLETIGENRTGSNRGNGVEVFIRFSL